MRSAGIGAFNLDDALPAGLGGLVIAAGIGCTAPVRAGAAPAASASALAVDSGALERRTAGRGRPVARRSAESITELTARR